MEEYSSYYKSYANSGQKLEVINGKAYSVSNVYVGRSPSSLSKPSISISSVPPPPSSYNNMFGSSNKVSRKMRSSSSWYNDPEMKRRKRIAQYKWYSVEGKVKVSLKNGFRWFRRTCRKIVSGF